MCRAAFALLAAIACLIPDAAAGQAVDLGVKVGGVFSDFDSHEGGFESETRPALGGGAHATIWLTEFLAVQPELLFTPKGAELGAAATDLIGAEIALNYVVIPLLLRVSAPPDDVAPFGYVGPALGFRLSCTLSGDDETGTDLERDCDVADVGELPEFRTRSTELAVVGGLGLAVPFGAVSIVMEGRLDYGLGDIHDIGGLVDTVDPDIATRTTSVFFGLTVPLTAF